MSQTATPAEPQAPTEAQIKEAQETLRQNVYVPAFFARLEQKYGLTPANDDEAYDYMKLAYYAQHLRAQQIAKQAQQQGSILKRAAARLEQAAGLTQEQRVAAHHNQLDELAKVAAADMVKEPQLQQAVALYAAAIAAA